MNLPYLRPLGDETLITKVADNLSVRLEGVHHSPGFWLHLPVELKRSLVERAGLDWFALLRRNITIRFAVLEFAEICQAIGDNMLYGANRNNYYLEMFKLDNSSEWRMIVKYQSILGFRLLCQFDSAVAETILDRLVDSLKSTKELTMREDQWKLKGCLQVARTESEELALLKVDGQKLLLPAEQLDHYASIKTRVAKAGGSYNSRGWFDFENGIDVAEVLSDLQSGKLVNFKKDQQFFATSADEADRMVDDLDDISGLRVLEPSAGDGALADRARGKGADVVVVENWAVNVKKLAAKGYQVHDKDFLSVTADDIGYFDVIIANPPFTKDQDIAHVLHMWTFLKPNGKLSVLMSTTWKRGRTKRHQEFLAWLDANGASIQEVAPGAFKASGTTVGALHVTLTKREEREALPLAA